MLGMELTGQPPFHTIYMHGLVRDGKGQKMSKTKGNVVDPIETIDGYGTDALRLALVTGVTPGQDVPLSMEKITANRNFANKLWNTGRFLLIGLQELPQEEVQKLAVTGPMGQQELDAMPLPERCADYHPSPPPSPPSPSTPVVGPPPLLTALYSLPGTLSRACTPSPPT